MFPLPQYSKDIGTSVFRVFTFFSCETWCISCLEILNISISYDRRVKFTLMNFNFFTLLLPFL